MEHVLGHVDVEEMYLDVDPENLPDKGEIVETAHFFVGQAYNAHIHVVEKESGDITRTYDNGQPGNKVGWNKKKEES